MENIKIIRYDEYRYRIQTHVDGIYDMSEPMEERAILNTLKKSIQELGILILMRDPDTINDVIAQYNSTQEAYRIFTSYYNGWLCSEFYDITDPLGFLISTQEVLNEKK
jgi:hypothetical protein|tara:strand:- start:329 stop:655 length:327 start_codon:yes stop_codon:yes gene_type:complete